MLLLFLITALIKLDTTESQCPPTTASIQRLLDEAYIPGAAIVVTNTTDIIYEQGFGYHSPPISEQRQRMNPSSSIFLLGSISKPFIAVAAMQMVESNLLNLDIDINQYLSPLMKIVHPYYPNVTITTRHLLSHTAGIGLNRVQQDEHYVPGDSFTQINLSDVIQKYVNDNASWLPIPPGNRTYISNIGTTLAALIIERLARISFEQYVQDRILKPLSIDEKQAAYRLSNFDDNKERLVDHYIYNASWLEIYQQRMPQLNIIRAGNLSNWLYIPFFSISTYPASSLRMTAHSLALFFQSFLNNFTTLLHNPSSVEELLYVFPQQSYTNRFNRTYSLIWNWEYFGERRLVGHQGVILGLTNIMMANEERNLGVIILTNGDTTRTDYQEQQVRETRNKLMYQLFDCFETPRNMGSDQRLNFIYILEIMSILCIYLFNFSK